MKVLFEKILEFLISFLIQFQNKIFLRTNPIFFSLRTVSDSFICRIKNLTLIQYMHNLFSAS